MTIPNLHKHHYAPLAWLTAGVLMLLLASCSDSGGGSSGLRAERFLFTSSNSNSGNQILTMSISSTGTLTETAQTPTGSPGDSDDGDFDGQDSLIIVDSFSTDYLLVVNAGEDTAFPNSESSANTRTNANGSISVFSIGAQGTLTAIRQTESGGASNNVNSRGVRPVSLSSAQIGGQIWVLVANQYDNPLCQSGTCDAATATDLRNIQSFVMDSAGQLTYSTTLATFNDGQNGGPSQVSFSPDGNMVSVTTWGIPNLGTLTQTQLDGIAGYQESRVYVWNVRLNNANLMFSNPRSWLQEGVSGSIGFQWSPDSSKLYVTNFNVATDLQQFSVVSLSVTDTAVELIDQSGTRGNTLSATSPPDEACWAWLNPTGSRLYTASFNRNILSYFNVNRGDGNIDFNTFYTRNNPSTPIPDGDTKDIYVLADDTFLYLSGALRSHTISIYAINSDGTLQEAGFSPYLVPSALGTTEFQQAFLGLVAY